DLLGGEPRPGVLAPGDPARHLLVLHGAEQRGGQRGGGVAPRRGAAPAVVTARAIVASLATVVTWRPGLGARLARFAALSRTSPALSPLAVLRSALGARTRGSRPRLTGAVALALVCHGRK